MTTKQLPLLSKPTVVVFVRVLSLSTIWRVLALSLAITLILPLIRRSSVNTALRQRRPFSRSITRIMDPSLKYEEENLAWYFKDKFPAVRIGQVFAQKYRAIGKLGFGSYSTVWLCRNMKYESLVEDPTASAHRASIAITNTCR